MKPPELKRFNEGDYPNAPPWFPGFISILNRFMEQVFTILNKNVTIGENITGRYFGTSFRTRGDYAAGGFEPIVINWTFPVKPQCVSIAQIATDPPTKILSPTSLQWVYSGSGVSVIYVAGLQASTNYVISIQCV